MKVARYFHIPSSFMTPYIEHFSLAKTREAIFECCQNIHKGFGEDWIGHFGTLIGVQEDDAEPPFIPEFKGIMPHQDRVHDFISQATSRNLKTTFVHRCPFNDLTTFPQSCQVTFRRRDGFSYNIAYERGAWNEARRQTHRELLFTQRHITIENMVTSNILALDVILDNCDFLLLSPQMSLPKPTNNTPILRAIRQTVAPEDIYHLSIRG